MIPVFNPASEYFLLKQEIEDAVRQVLESGNYILGNEVTSFEHEFAQYTGAKYSVGVGSGTDALYLALRAMNISGGDEVITVSHTAVATVTAIVQTGAIPVFTDIDPDTFLVYVDQIEKKITAKTKAILPVHLYGNAADLNKIMTISKKYKIPVIEDCAQAFGTTFNGKNVGCFGDCGCFSFYPTKNLGAIGDGGIIVTNNEKTYSDLLVLRQYGWKERYISSIHGWNSRLDEIQAAILRVKLRHFHLNLNKRQEVADYYYTNINNPLIKLPKIPKGSNPSFHLFVVKTKDRDDFMKYLKANEISSLIHYPLAVHQQEAYKNFLNDSDLKNTNEIMQQIVSIPFYPYIKMEHVEKVVTVINSYKS